MFSTFKNHDPYNNHHRRNRDNTYVGDYNCGGFALGTYSWYMPYRINECSYVSKKWYIAQESLYDAKRADEFGKKLLMQQYYSTIEHLTCLFTNRILDDFPTCRIITSVDEADLDETIILFRTGDDDFHFVVSFDHKHWFHKCGAHEIEEVCEDEVFNTEWERGRYNGRIVIFAKREEREE